MTSCGGTRCTSLDPEGGFAPLPAVEKERALGPLFSTCLPPTTGLRRQSRRPRAAEIALLALLVSWLVGLPAGIASAVRPNGWLGAVARVVSIVFIAVPGFWLGLLIVLALLFWFGYKAPIIIVHVWENPWQNLQQVIGSAIVLGLAQGAY